MAFAWQSFDPTDTTLDGVPDNGRDVFTRRFRITF